MIVLDLRCRSGGHGFEGWFASRAAFDDQADAGDLMCPTCGSADVERMVTAARLGRKGNQLAGGHQQRADRPRMDQAPTMQAGGGTVAGDATMPDERMNALLARVAEVQAATLPKSRWVGGQFANAVRKMAAGDAPQALIHGQATAEEARALVDDGLPVLPLLVPFLPPDERH